MGSQPLRMKVLARFCLEAERGGFQCAIILPPVAVPWLCRARDRNRQI